jgi:ketosteroid isomerase-like protein
MAAAPAKPAGGSDEAKLQKLMDDHVASFNKGDWQAIQTEFTADAMLMHQFSPTATGPAAIAGMFRDDFKEIAASTMKLSLAARIDETKILGDWAFYRGIYTFTAVATAGQPRTREVRFLEILQKQPNGSWKIARSMDNTATWPYVK